MQHYEKKLDLRGVMTAPGFSMKKKDLLTQIEKTPEPQPHPYKVAFRRPSENWAGVPPVLWIWDGMRGFF